MPRCQEVPTTAVPDEGTRIRRAVSSGRPETQVLRVCGWPQERKVAERLWIAAAGERGGESGTRDRPPERAAMGLPLTAADDGTTPDCR